MKIENQNITVNLIKGLSFIGGLIIVVWKISALTIGVQQGINSRFERLEGQVEVISTKQTNQFKSIKNDRKRDSADAANRFKAQDEKLDILLYKLSPYNQKPISSN